MESLISHDPVHAMKTDKMNIEFHSVDFNARDPYIN